MTAVVPLPAPPVPTDPPATVLVTVAVPTFRRPAELRAVLPLLLAQARELTARAGGHHRASLLVVDNDPARTAEAVVAELAAPEVRYVGEPVPGIAVVRDRAVAESAGARLLAFIDDDERPLPGWLAALVDTWEQTRAVAVSGRVLAEYTGELDPWLRAGDFFVRRSLPTGSAIDVAATNNLLLDLDQVRVLGVRFESALALAGGEDSLFSRSLARAGGRLVWCDEAVVVDVVPRERMTRRWVLTRAWSHGNASLLTDLRLTAGALPRARVRARGVVRGLLRVAGGGARWCWGRGTGSPRHQARGLRALLRGAGMAAGACGVVFQEYARSGRRWQLSRTPAR